jgi:hypothetical protein
MDAKATEKVLDYQWRRMGLETKYEDALLWAMTTGKAFWWFRWNKDASRPRADARAGVRWQRSITRFPVGDVEVEVGTAFELLVADPVSAHR